MACKLYIVMQNGMELVLPICSKLWVCFVRSVLCSISIRTSCAPACTRHWWSNLFCAVAHLFVGEAPCGWYHNAAVLPIAVCLQRHGPAVASLLRQQQVRTQRLEDFRRSVEKRLRLRRLSRDPSLQDERFVSCCKRMLHNSDSLLLIMDGLSFRISQANQVSSDGTRIDIAWDFEV